jgi:hypothetical protein
VWYLAPVRVTYTVVDADCAKAVTANATNSTSATARRVTGRRMRPPFWFRESPFWMARLRRSTENAELDPSAEHGAGCRGHTSRSILRTCRYLSDRMESWWPSNESPTCAAMRSSVLSSVYWSLAEEAAVIFAMLPELRASKKK